VASEAAHRDALESLFTVFEHILSTTRAKYSTGLLPIVFDFATEPPVIWSFDPRRSGRMFLPGNVPDAALRIFLEPKTLLSLLADDVLEVGDVLGCDGDLQALSTLARSLTPAKGLLQTRVEVARERSSNELGAKGRGGS
jgi:hypothetical protein